jgi:hypothetical protein
MTGQASLEPTTEEVRVPTPAHPALPAAPRPIPEPRSGSNRGGHHDTSHPPDAHRSTDPAVP